MANRKDDEPEADPAADSSDASSGKPGFPIHEHIGRTLKSLFEEVEAQPIPEKLRELLDELERKKGKDS